MNRLKIFILSLAFFVQPNAIISQEKTPENIVRGHVNNNKFKQLYDEFSTPNNYRTASGKPGKDYYQQQVDYVMDIILDDEKYLLYREENFSYKNNSHHQITY